jgi:dTDP-4-amino-4,6-dideoxygalactose transaminase
MYRFGQEEIDAVARVARSGKLFRYGMGGECERFERRYAKYLGVKHAGMTSSGTTALTAALIGLGIGPGDEVIVPAHTYMATAVAVLAAGAIPVIVDVDQSICLSPDALDDAVGPCTRAVIPVHMWGQVCDMDAIMRIARKRKLLVLEDACQAVGGGYEGRMAGSIGHAGAFSFNYYKNMTCGEGGCIVTSDDEVFQRASCATDCCRFYWDGRDTSFRGFSASGSRASEFEGAILNVQLDRLGDMVRRMRRQKKRILRQTARAAAAAGIRPVPLHSPDYECASYTMFTCAQTDQATKFAELTGGTILAKTGRHTCNEWDPILSMRGAGHPDMDPYNLPANRRCRRRSDPSQWAASLPIIQRTVMIANHPDRSEQDLAALIVKIRSASAAVGESGPARSAGRARRARRGRPALAGA